MQAIKVKRYTRICILSIIYQHFTLRLAWRVLISADDILFFFSYFFSEKKVFAFHVNSSTGSKFFHFRVDPF